MSSAFHLGLRPTGIVLNHCSVPERCRLISQLIAFKQDKYTQNTCELPRLCASGVIGAHSPRRKATSRWRWQNPATVRYTTPQWGKNCLHEESLKYLDNLKSSLRMITVFKFEKSSNSHIRAYIADQVTINCKVLSPLYVGPTRVVLLMRQVSSKMWTKTLQCKENDVECTWPLISQVLYGVIKQLILLLLKDSYVISCVATAVTKWLSSAYKTVLYSRGKSKLWSKQRSSKKSCVYVDLWVISWNGLPL